MAEELQFIQSYKDIDRMIETHEMIIENCKMEIKYYQMQMSATRPKDANGLSMDGMPHGNLSPISLDRAIENIEHDYNMIYLEEEAIKRLQAKKREIEEKTKEFEGLYLKVAVKRYIETTADGKPKTYKMIADELGYDEGYIRHIGADIENSTNKTQTS